jgi:hypothetical protein
VSPYPPLRFKTVVERHHAKLPCFATVPLSTVARWGLNATTTIEGSINGAPLGRRSIKLWKERRCWFIDLPVAVCRKAGVEIGDRVDIELRVADASFPDELAALTRGKRHVRRPVRKRART